VNTSKFTERDAIEFLRDRDRHLVRMHTRRGMEWFISPDVGKIKDELAEALIARPDIQPSHDGLWAGCDQTFQYWVST
jgi:hypothetical protein